MDDQMRAHQAQLLLDNEIFKEALEQVNQGINRDMDRVKDDDVKAMQALVLQRKAANRIVNHIVTVAQSNKVTEYNTKVKRKRF